MEKSPKRNSIEIPQDEPQRFTTVEGVDEDRLSGRMEMWVLVTINVTSYSLLCVLWNNPDRKVNGKEKECCRVYQAGSHLMVKSIVCNGFPHLPWDNGRKPPRYGNSDCHPFLDSPILIPCLFVPHGYCLFHCHLTLQIGLWLKKINSFTACLVQRFV